MGFIVDINIVVDALRKALTREELDNLTKILTIDDSDERYRNIKQYIYGNEDMKYRITQHIEYIFVAPSLYVYGKNYEL